MNTDYDPSGVAWNNRRLTQAVIELSAKLEEKGQGPTTKQWQEAFTALNSCMQALQMLDNHIAGLVSRVTAIEMALEDGATNEAVQSLSQTINEEVERIHLSIDKLRTEHGTAIQRLRQSLSQTDRMAREAYDSST